MFISRISAERLDRILLLHGILVVGLSKNRHW